MASATQMRTLEIDGMSDNDCVQNVTTALKDVEGVTTRAVEVGHAVISCRDQARSQAACAAIRAAGYDAREAVGPFKIHQPAAPRASLSAIRREALPSESTAQPADNTSVDGADTDRYHIWD